MPRKAAAKGKQRSAVAAAVATEVKANEIIDLTTSPSTTQRPQASATGKRKCAPSGEGEERQNGASSSSNSSSSSITSDLESKFKNAPASIQKPGDRNRNRRDMLPFVVYQSSTRPCDEPNFDFESSFTSKQEANARVEYLFFRDTLDGTVGTENEYYRSQKMEVSQRTLNGLLRLETEAGGEGEKVIVATVPAVAYQFMLRDLDAEQGRPVDATTIRAHLRTVPDTVRELASQNRNRNDLLEYVVWKSAGYRPSRFHGYDGPPAIEFDSSFATKDDANARAVYVCFKDNQWGITVDEVLEMEVMERTQGGGLRRFEVQAEDGEQIVVAAVPADAYRHREGNSEEESDASRRRIG